MTINVRGTLYQENLNNAMRLEFYDLSHPWGLGQPCWPYFEDVKIERLRTMARSGVLTQRITTVMHSGTHIGAPAHVVQGTAFMDEVPLPHFFGTGVVVSIPKKKWEVITAANWKRPARRSAKAISSSSIPADISTTAIRTRQTPSPPCWLFLL